MIFASVLKKIKKGLDKIKNKCYNKYIGKQKKDFVSQGIADWQNKNNLLYYIRREMIPPREIKKGIDKGCKICYNVFIADTKDRKCPHKKLKCGLTKSKINAIIYV